MLLADDTTEDAKGLKDMGERAFDAEAFDLPMVKGEEITKAVGQDRDYEPSEAEYLDCELSLLVLKIS